MVIYYGWYGNEYCKFMDLFHYGVKRYHYEIFLVWENSWNDLLLIASIIFLQLTPGISKRYIPLLDEIDYGETVSNHCFIHFPVPYIDPHRAALFITSLSTLLHCQPLLWCYILLFLQNTAGKGAKEGGRYNSTSRVYCNGKSLPSVSILLNRKLHFSMDVISPTIRSTTLNTRCVNALWLTLNPLLFTVDIFDLSIPFISSYALFLFVCHQHLLRPSK